MSSSTEKSNVCAPGSACEFQDNLDMLRQIEFFSSLPLETLKVFAYLCTRERYRAGELLFEQGEADGQAFYIIDGTATLELESEHGPNQGVVQELNSFGPGTFLGGLALLGDVRRLFSLRAKEDCLCLVLTKEKFSKTLAQFPGILERMLDAVANSVLNWEKQFLQDHAAACLDCARHAGVSLV